MTCTVTDLLNRCYRKGSVRGLPFPSDTDSPRALSGEAPSFSPRLQTLEAAAWGTASESPVRSQGGPVVLVSWCSSLRATLFLRPRGGVVSVSPRPPLAVGGASRAGSEGQAGTRVPRWGAWRTHPVGTVFLCAHLFLQLL